MPLHRWYLRKPHCPRLIIVVFLIREIVRVNSPPDPVVALENLILKTVNGEFIQDKGRVDTGHAGAHDTDLDGKCWTVFFEFVFDFVKRREVGVLGQLFTEQEAGSEAREGGK